MALIRFASLYADFVKTTMVHRNSYDIFVILIFVATVRGLNITRCIGPYNDSYTCPGLSDPPERTHCCLWDGQPACCLPGGSSCSDSHADKRNYCPSPNDARELAQCCVWNGQPACCLPGGSSCSDSADIRSYCPGPDHGSERTHCCVWDKQPTCCYRAAAFCTKGLKLAGLSGRSTYRIRDYCPGPNGNKNDANCCGEFGTACCRKWNRTDWIVFGVVLFAVLAFFAVCCCGAIFQMCK